MVNKEELQKQVESVLKEDSQPSDSAADNSNVEVSANSETFSEFERKMMEKGWKPDGEKTAEQWLDDGFEIRGKRVDALYKTVDYLKAKLDRDEKLAHDRAVQELNAEKVRAIELSDVKRVSEIEAKQASMLDPSKRNLIAEFEQKHSDWLKGTSHQAQKMSDAAMDRFGKLLNSGLPMETQLESLENYMVGEFPDYFNKTKQISDAPTMAVEGGQSGVVASKGRKRSYSINDLSDDQRMIAKTLEKKGVMSIQDYIKDLVKSGDL